MTALADLPKRKFIHNGCSQTFRTDLKERALFILFDRKKSGCIARSQYQSGYQGMHRHEVSGI